MAYGVDRRRSSNAIGIAMPPAILVRADEVIE